MSDLLDLPAAARRLGVSPRTVAREIAEGRLSLPSASDVPCSYGALARQALWLMDKESEPRP